MTTAMYATFVVHDLRRTTPVGRLRRFAVGIVVVHGSKYDLTGLAGFLHSGLYG